MSHTDSNKKTLFRVRNAGSPEKVDDAGMHKFLTWFNAMLRLERTADITLDERGVITVWDTTETESETV